ncbi:MAG: carbamoyltransferase HypF [Colwellia sp.]|nr:carbamoyltransferase HypF [Colwellia sp.]
MYNSYHICVQGLVQGVGFRPHVFSQAIKLALTGNVYNDGSGVKINLNATSAQLDEFLSSLRSELPPLASIDDISICENDNVINDHHFEILVSQQSAISTQITPDAATCDQCLSELLDPKNRRYHYPFINCTHCGPRFSIIKKLPYDRPYTTMGDFELCQQCLTEYNSPLNRRFHAQPNACPTCGPELSLYDTNGKVSSESNIIKQTVELLKQGKIVAIKGIGGYHLVCDGQNIDTVNRLRDKKQRKTKPLSMMVKNINVAKTLVRVTQAAETYLTSACAPIVLMKKNNRLFEHLSPNINSLGIMLPYTPIHHLLFQHTNEPLFLVMTSANLRDQPLIYKDDEMNALFSLADYVLNHNRAIDKRIDDSIVNCINEPEYAIIIRRGRGMAPKAIDLAIEGKSTLALGGFFKNNICLTKGKKAYLSHYIGNLDTPENCRYLQETVSHFIDVFQIIPQQVVADLHPDFYSSAFARQFAKQKNIPLITIQHHHAHGAAVACEHHITCPYITLALDGVGLGSDGSSWGGECLKITGATSSRLGHFLTLPLPGGDIAAKQPWRIATAFLIEHGMADIAQQRFGQENGFSIVKQMIARNINCPQTTSAGRLFDVAAALLGFTTTNSFEAEAAILLESASEQGNVNKTERLFKLLDDNTLDFSPLLIKLTTMSANDGAATFHYQLAFGLSEWLSTLAIGNIDTVVLAGGCFLNQALTAAVTK